MILSLPSRCGVSKSKPNLAARSVYSEGISSKTVTTPGSPRRNPSAMNCEPSTDFPDPDGPANKRLSPSGIPPPISSSSPRIPVDTRRLPLT